MFNVTGVLIVDDKSDVENIIAIRFAHRCK